VYPDSDVGPRHHQACQHTHFHTALRNNVNGIISPVSKYAPGRMKSPLGLNLSTKSERLASRSGRLVSGKEFMVIIWREPKLFPESVSVSEIFGSERF
jgi:hypothetical protein